MTHPLKGPCWSDLPMEVFLRILQCVLATYYPQTMGECAMLAFRDGLASVCYAWAIELRKATWQTLSLRSANDFFGVVEHMQMEKDGKASLPFASLVRNLDIASMTPPELDVLAAESNKVR